LFSAAFASEFAWAYLIEKMKPTHPPIRIAVSMNEAIDLQILSKVETPMFSQ
jgi:hypothetical protein